ncbi:MAG: Sec-independent protein translocase protein TatB [Actinomycetota bacterium]|nr:Sec-independent protein translocase protein TatB [Actinomycetota bacterium]
MPSIGPLEILTVAVVALVVLGPERLPEIARNIGKAVNELRRMTSEMKDEFSSGLTVEDEDEVPEPAKPLPPTPDEQER